MITEVITYKIDIAYSYEEEDLPNLSMLTTRKLKERLAGGLEFVRQQSSLNHSEVTADWIEVL